MSRDWLQREGDDDNNDADRPSTETANSSDVSLSDLAIRDLPDSATDHSVEEIQCDSTDQAQRMSASSLHHHHHHHYHKHYACRVSLISFTRALF